MRRSGRLKHDPAAAQERADRRAARREADGPRPEDRAKEARRENGERAHGPARRRRPLRGPTDRERSQAWATGKRPCAVCGAAAHLSEAHHIITQQQLRKIAPVVNADIERLRWDTRNRLWLCERHHAAHHARMKPIGRCVLWSHAPKVFQLAHELNLTAWVERTYPDNAGHPASQPNRRQ